VVWIACSVKFMHLLSLEFMQSQDDFFTIASIITWELSPNTMHLIRRASGGRKLRIEGTQMQLNLM